MLWNIIAQWKKQRHLKKYVGGSPANIAIGSSKLGLKAGFIGELADDQHRRFIEQYIRGLGVDTSHMVVDTEGHKTGLAFTEIKSFEECSILIHFSIEKILY